MAKVGGAPENLIPAHFGMNAATLLTKTLRRVLRDKTATIAQILEASNLLLEVERFTLLKRQSKPIKPNALQRVESKLISSVDLGMLLGRQQNQQLTDNQANGTMVPRNGTEVPLDGTMVP